MDDFWNVAAGVTLAICNEGLAAGLVIGVLVALRPLTNRLLTAGQRVALWNIFWFIKIKKCVLMCTLYFILLWSKCCWSLF